MIIKNAWERKENPVWDQTLSRGRGEIIEPSGGDAQRSVRVEKPNLPDNSVSLLPKEKKRGRHSGSLT